MTGPTSKCSRDLSIFSHRYASDPSLVQLRISSGRMRTMKMNSEPQLTLCIEDTVSINESDNAARFAPSAKKQCINHVGKVRSLKGPQIMSTATGSSSYPRRPLSKVPNPPVAVPKSIEEGIEHLYTVLW